MASVFFELAAMQALAANYEETLVRLSPDSLALLLSTEPLTQPAFRWRGAAGPVDDTEADTIDALVGTCYAELMTPIIEGPTMPLGMVFPFVTSAVPTGALECDGATYLRTDYPDLYAALDSAYIVDADHFKVPDLLGRTVIGVGHGTGLSTYAMDASGGEESHILSTAQLPNHSHAVTDPGHTHTLTDPGHAHNITVRGNGNPGIYNAGTNQGIFVTGSTTTVTTGVTQASATTGILVGSTGSGAGHENRQPYRALRYAIWAS